MNSGWFETDGKTTRAIPVGWRKEWVCENVYAWHWYGPPHSRWVDLCVLLYEPDAAQRAEIEQRFANAETPTWPSPDAIKAGKEWADREEARLRKCFPAAPTPRH